jgi:hypothetical protein
MQEVLCQVHLEAIERLSNNIVWDCGKLDAMLVDPIHSDTMPSDVGDAGHTMCHHVWNTNTERLARKQLLGLN